MGTGARCAVRVTHHGNDRVVYDHFPDVGDALLEVVMPHIANVARLLALHGARQAGGMGSSPTHGAAVPAPGLDDALEPRSARAARDSHWVAPVTAA